MHWRLPANASAGDGWLYFQTARSRSEARLKYLWLIACVQCALLTGPTHAAQAARYARSVPGSPGYSVPAQDLLYASPTTRDHVGRIVAPVMIDGGGPYPFIVDTGASYSSISPALVATLKLSAADALSLEVNGITGSAREPSALIQTLAAGALRLEDVRLPVVWAPLMAGADGILGVAGLAHDCIVVDFEWNRVSISRCSRLSVPVEAREIVAYRLNGGLIAIAAHIGRLELPAVIDTGSAHTLGNLPLRNVLYASPRSDPAASTKVYGATPQIADGQLEPAPSIRLGSIAISGGTIVYGDFHIFHVWGLTQHPAVIIGMDVLGTVARLGIDFGRPEIYLQGTKSVSPIEQVY
jgi:predicted aspartyl protease